MRVLSRIIPAYAGSTPPHPTAPSSTPDHPRIRGEHSNGARPGARPHGSSPHTRGALEGSSKGERVSRIIPAYAGSTPSSGPPAFCPSDHPRIRGEHRLHVDSCGRDFGSSPHTRGARDTVSECERRHRIIPAYAGSTPAGRRRRPNPPDHPRIRGEHPPRGAAATMTSGSSPHTRGARQSRRVGGDDIGIIPAYAGSTDPRPVSSGD